MTPRIREDRAVNLLLVELRLLNSRTAILLVATGLYIGVFFGGFVYGIAVGAGGSADNTWPWGLGAGILAFIGFLLLMPSRGSITEALERDEGRP
jgi:hypothetical protein